MPILCCRKGIGVLIQSLRCLTLSCVESFPAQDMPVENGSEIHGLKQERDGKEEL
ncbi:hypothetical protein SAMN04488028_10184 [Reichenbachiella agariperforans]|uniref:Uncharacterized protein n=1 Tax=Reichenbachiella agariperforans TaxID=156994 RepID=A0A1M6J8G3_REIAG|nr:hypothetical protein SAMN04488028_10184 [Reichenbachiella agariperforans]